MLLWTIIEGDIYVEYSPYANISDIENDKNLQMDHFKQIMQSNVDTFPKNIQFWTRVNSEYLDKKHFRLVSTGKDQGFREIDSEFPYIYWDNHQDHNVIVIPGNKWLINHEQYKNDSACISETTL